MSFPHTHRSYVQSFRKLQDFVTTLTFQMARSSILKTALPADCFTVTYIPTSFNENLKLTSVMLFRLHFKVTLFFVYLFFFAI